MTDQSSRFIGSIPEHYDRSLGPRLFAGYACDIAARVSELQPTSVLELAAGTGIVTRQLRDALPAQCSLVASDLNPPMLEAAMAKFVPGEDVRFEPADATNLPFDSDTFDVVVCQFGVMFFPDKARSYEEVRRVLKPGGDYLFSVWGSWQDNPFARVAHETVASFFPDDPPGFYRVPFGYHDEEVIRAALSGAGFSQINLEQVDISSEIPSADEFATGLVYGNPLLEEISSRGGNPREVCAAMATAIGEQLGQRMRLQAFVIKAGTYS